MLEEGCWFNSQKGRRIWAHFEGIFFQPFTEQATSWDRFSIHGTLKHNAVLVKGGDSGRESGGAFGRISLTIPHQFRSEIRNVRAELKFYLASSAG